MYRIALVSTICFLISLIAQTDLLKNTKIWTIYHIDSLYWEIHNSVADCPCINEMNKANAILEAYKVTSMNKNELKKLLGSPDQTEITEQLIDELKVDETWLYTKHKHLCLYFQREYCVLAVPCTNSYQGVRCFNHSSSGILVGRPIR